MKSTELSAALTIEAKRYFKRHCAESTPWNRSTYVERAHAFKQAWQFACIDAGVHLGIPTRCDVFREIYGRAVPIGDAVIEG